MALTIEIIMKQTRHMYAIAEKDGFTKKGVRNMYMAEAMSYSEIEDNDRAKVESFFLRSYHGKSENPEKKKTDEPTAAVYGKYKPVALKVKPVYTELPDEYSKMGLSHGMTWSTTFPRGFLLSSSHSYDRT